MTTQTTHNIPFAALRNRDFRLLWSGQLISQMGSTMQTLTINWHISVLTNYDPLALGLVGLSRFLPIVFFSLIGGAVADARDRRRLMLLTQSAMAIFAAILGYLTDRGLSIVWPIYILNAMSAAAWAFDNPARQALVPSLVPREQLANAMSLNSIMFQTATIAGPTIAGFLIAAHSVSIVYWINALSFLAVIVALLLMHPVQVKATRKIDVGSVREGLSFVRHQPIILSTMTLDFFATFFSSASQLLPIFAAKILNVGAQGFGFLEAAPAVGALLSGSTMSIMVTRIKRPGSLILWSVALYGLATIAFGLSASFWLSLIFLGLTGIADNVSTILRSTIRQLVTPDQLRGRM
ncbi:MAG TPA: MFS transporter, partial [Anaerolineae bacterium]|nr:MFS transporter [Anaerolineae bacterium]